MALDSAAEVDDLSSDLDSISVNSTIPEDDQDHYELDGGILAERSDDGEMQYLVKWQNYDESYNTWEPEDNFDSDVTLKEWKDKKMRITRGLAKPFNMPAFEFRVQRILEDKAQRQRRRRQKRRRLGMTVASSSSSSFSSPSDEESDIEMVDALEVPRNSSKPSSNHVNKPQDKSRQRLSQVELQSSSAASKVWTDQENKALESGLKRFGFDWDAILDFFGPNGKINHDLRFKPKSSLAKRVPSMRAEFEGLDRDPPEWLKDQQQSEARPPEPGANKTSSPSDRLNRGKPTKQAKNGTATKIAPRPIVPRSYAGTLNLSAPNEARSQGTQSTFLGLTTKTATPGPNQEHHSKIVSSNSKIRPTKVQAIAKQAVPGKATAIRNRSEASSSLPSRADILKGFHFRKLRTQRQVNQKRLREPAPVQSDVTFLDPKTGKPSVTAGAQTSGNSSRFSNTKNVGVIATASTNTSTDRLIDKQQTLPVDKKSIDERLNPTATNIVPAKSLQGGRPSSPLFIPSTLDEPMPDIQLTDPMPRMTEKRPTEETSAGLNRLSESIAHATTPIIVSGATGPFDRPSPRPLNVASFRLRSEATIEEQEALFRYYVRDQHVQGDVVLGLERRDMYKVRLQEFDRDLQLKLLDIKTPRSEVHFDLRKQCTACDYQAFFPATPLDYIGSGYIVFAAQVRKPLEQFAKQLARDLSGAIFFAANFTMLVYPVGASAWSFLDDALPDVPVGAILKFVVRKPLLPQTPLNEHSDLRNWMGLNSRLVESTMHDSAVARESLNVAFKDQFDIEFPRLIGTKAAVFFLCFAPSGKWFDMMSTLDQDRIKLKVSAEHDEVVDFLHSNKAEVYSMHDYGVSDPVENRAWFYFIEYVKSGVLIIHDSCFEIHRIPWLQYCLYGAIDVWKLSLIPMGEDERHDHLVRLFPHGGVILITDSVMLYSPLEALRVLRWFRLQLKPDRVPGTWKIALRPQPRPWLLKILDLYDDTGYDIFEGVKQTFADIYTEIDLLLENEKPLERPYTMLWDQETPSDDAPLVAAANASSFAARPAWHLSDAEPPVITPDHENIRASDDLLLTWFGQWSIAHAATYRKFCAIIAPDPPSFSDSTKPISERSSPEKQDQARRPNSSSVDRVIQLYKDKYTHVKFAAPDVAAKQFNISPLEELAEKESNRRKMLRDKHIPSVREIATRAIRKEREVARDSLQAIKEIYSRGGTDEDVVKELARQHLRSMGASEREVRDGEIIVDEMDIDEPEKDNDHPQSIPPSLFLPAPPPPPPPPATDGS